MISRTSPSWWCEHFQYLCEKRWKVTPSTIPFADYSNSKSVIVSWNETAPIIVVGLLICILIFLILNLRKKAHHPGYGINITLVEEGVVNFAAQPQFVKNAC